MNKTVEYVGGIHTTYEVEIQDLISQKMEAYALLLVILSTVFILYVLWNNFVRSPSKKIGFKSAIESNINPEKVIEGLSCDEGIEPSLRVKKISRAIDEYVIIPAIAMFYISLSYYLSI